MIAGACVFPLMSVGIIDASMPRTPSIPRTRSCVSTTAISSFPILQDPTGWLGRFAIRPQFRRQGFGAAGIHQICPVVRSVGSRELWVFAGSHDEVSI
jgi:hypothetical protein